MNTQQQEIDVVQHEAKWQAPELVELGNVNSVTLNGFGGLMDGLHNNSTS